MEKLAWLLVALGLAGCPWPRAPVPPAPRALAWSDCGRGFQCATLDVPLDHARPEGTRIPLALARRRADDPTTRIGVLVTNPGGPGISAVDHLRGRARDFGAPLRERFDLVAFDTRGTGESAPLDCHASVDALLSADPTPESDAEWQATLAASRALAEDCARKHGELLRFLGTGESARDLELLRAALGEEQLSYLGYSYGTALGASYASLYPERVRAMVLDAAIDPGFELIAFAREQSEAVERAFGAYDAAAAEEGWPRGDALRAVTARAESAPIPSRAGTRPARASDVLYGSVEAVVEAPRGWRELAEALGRAQDGDGSDFVRLSDRYFRRSADGRSALRVEAQLGVLCADLHRPASAEAIRSALPELAQASPHVGVANLLSLLPCVFWPEPARALEPPRRADGPAILVVAGARDPLTPRVWGERMARALGSARLLDVDSDLHTSYGRSDPCVARAVEAALLAPESLPGAPARCGPRPS